MTFSAVERTKYISNAAVRNVRTPFIAGSPIEIVSLAGTTLYGANHPGTNDTTKYNRIVWGEGQDTRVFELPSGLNTAANSATTVSNLRAVALLDGAILQRAGGSTAPAAGQWCIAAGGGTGVAASGIQVDGGASVGATTLSIRHTALATGVETILLGATLTIGGHAYTVTTGTFTFVDDTPVTISIYPAVVATIAADAAVTIAAGSGQTVMLGAVPVDEQILELIIFDAADVHTLAGGALVAGREYYDTAYDFMYAAGNTNLIAL